MNAERFRRDLELAMARYDERDENGKVIQEHVFWNDDASNRVLVIENVELPDNINQDHTNVRIPVPSNLYDPVADGQYYFYRDIYIDPGLKVFDPAEKKFVTIPLYGDRPRRRTGDDGWRYISIHPPRADEHTTVLDYLRMLQVYLASCLKYNYRRFY